MSEWINAKEKLPIKGELVLMHVVNKDKWCLLSGIYNDKFFFLDYINNVFMVFIDEVVTHWQRIDSPWKPIEENSA